MTRAVRFKEETNLRPDWEQAAVRGPWSYDPKTQRVIYLSAVTIDLRVLQGRFRPADNIPPDMLQAHLVARVQGQNAASARDHFDRALRDRLDKMIPPAQRAVAYRRLGL